MNAPLEATKRREIVRALPFDIVDLGHERNLLMSDALVEKLGEPAPTSWPRSARDAWDNGAAACRAMAVRPPWIRSELAKQCAVVLALRVLEAHAEGEGAKLIIIVDGAPQSPSWRARAYGLTSEGVGSDAQWVAEDNPERLSALLEKVWRGDTLMMPRHVARGPVAPSSNDPLLTSVRAHAFDPPAVAGCVRPMPSSIDVSPNVPMATLVEETWQRISSTVRTGPPTTCTLQAFNLSTEMGVRTNAATLDCQGLPLATAVKSVGADDDITSVANDLGADVTSSLIFDACKMQTR